MFHHCCLQDCRQLSALHSLIFPLERGIPLFGCAAVRQGAIGAAASLPRQAHHLVDAGKS